jgi:hypothetical protein
MVSDVIFHEGTSPGLLLEVEDKWFMHQSCDATSGAFLITFLLVTKRLHYSTLESAGAAPLQSCYDHANSSFYHSIPACAGCERDREHLQLFLRLKYSTVNLVISKVDGKGEMSDTSEINNAGTSGVPRLCSGETLLFMRTEQILYILHDP